MCGFVGYLGEHLPDGFDTLCDSISHRGPDARGSFDEGSVHLRHYRLSILDVDGSSQPLESGGGVIAYNGEIYNFLDQRRILEDLGRSFTTDGDTEVILQAYLEWGVQSFERLNGIFAFALYDRPRNQVVLVRDPFGVKPLYYHVTETGELMFSSELKAIVRAFPELRTDLDYEALDYLLTFKYLPEEHTLLKGIKKVLPGHCLRYSLADKSFELFQYSKMVEEFDPSRSTSQQEFFEQFKGAVKRQLISDVPLGAFLSGGIDSSCIVAMMRELRGEKSDLKTFSVVFPGEKWNEEEFSDRVVEHCKTDHTKVEMKQGDLLRYLPTVIWHLEEPFSDPACLPTYLLSREAKKKVSVVLTGEGADELLLGYKKYRLFRLLNWLRLPLIRWLVLLLVRFLPRKSLYRQIIEADLRSKSAAERILNTHKVFSTDEKEQLLTSVVREQMTDSVRRSVEQYFSEGDFMRNLQVLDMRTWMVNDPLLKMDKMSMAHGLEGRVPFLDLDFARYVFSLKEHYKLSRGLTDKWILRKALKSYLPEGILDRVKHPFNIPIRMFQDEIHSLFTERSVRERGLFQYEALKELLDGDWDSPHVITRIWLLVCIEVWLRTFVDQEAQGPITLH